MAALAPAAMAEDDAEDAPPAEPPVLKLPAIEGRDLARVALINEGASATDVAAAQLRVLGLVQGEDFVRAIDGGPSAVDSSFSHRGCECECRGCAGADAAARRHAGARLGARGAIARGRRESARGG